MGKLKPATNQPNIKLYAQVVGTSSLNKPVLSKKSTSKQSTADQQKDAIGYNKKKRSPPTPQEYQNPTKKINMSMPKDRPLSSSDVEVETEMKGKSREGPELSEELKQLR